MVLPGLAEEVGSHWIQCEDAVTGTQSSTNYRYANTKRTIGRIEGHKVALECNRMKLGEDFIVRDGASNQRVRDKRQVTMQAIQTRPKAHEKQ